VRIFSKLLIITITLSSFAGNLSPDAIAFLKDSPLIGTEQTNGSGARGATNSISGMIFISSAFDEAAFTSLGGYISTRTTDVYTVTIPVESLSELQDVRGLIRFSPSRRANLTMEKALEHGRAVDVYSGGGALAQKYSGEGVIIGVIDGGFEYLHPYFMDGSKLRVSRVWDQNGYGTPPAGYNYGTVLGNASDIRTAQRGTSDVTSHGSHVAGIAGGSLIQDRQGVAPSAELVFVETNLMDNGIVDGMRFIFDYADSVGKPAVINLSLGSHYGPHDGSSAIDRVIEAFTREGRIVVGAAGNEGSDLIHFSKTFNRDTVKTFVTIPAYEDDLGVSQINIWGEANKTFKVGFVLYENGQLVDKTDLVPLSTIERNGSASGVIGDNGTEYILFGEEESPMNGRPNVVAQISIQSSYIETIHYDIGVVVYGTSGTVHGWSITNANSGVPFFYDQGVEGFISGDSFYSVGEVGGTGRETISVGAFTSQTSFLNTDGQSMPAWGYVEGEIAPFSSVGPTVDQRIKPDITAPGDVIISAFRTDLPDLDGSVYVSDYIQNNGTDFPIGGFSGTSMATPFVTGAVALMLEADPTLTPREVRDILSQSAYEDSGTGVITTLEDSLFWGSGKIDVDKAIELVEQGRTKNIPFAAASSSARFVRSSETGGLELQLESDLAEKIHIQLLDLRGRVVFEADSEMALGISSIPFSMTSMASGAYLYRIVGQKTNMKGKMIILE